MHASFARAPSTRFASALALSLAACLCACGGQVSESSTTSNGFGDWTSAANGVVFRVEANHAGRAAQLRLVRVLSGRLVDVYAKSEASAEPVLVASDFLVPTDLEHDGTDWTMDRDFALGHDIVIVDHPSTSAAFGSTIARFDDELDVVQPKSASPVELPPFSSVARNSAVALCFDDLVDPASIDAESVRLSIGAPPDSPFAARVLADAHHGGWFTTHGASEFRSTRVLIDFAVDWREAALDPSLRPAPLGLPECSDASKANVAVRLATKGGHSLANAIGSPLSSSDALFDAASSTGDLVRAWRSRGSSAGDSNHGFASASAPLAVVGEQPISVTQVTALGGANYSVDFAFGTTLCAAPIAVRDVLIDGAGSIAIASSPSQLPINGVIIGAHVRVVSGSAPQVGAAELRSRWRPGLGVPPSCFVEVSPSPAGAPGRGVSTTSTLSVAFNQPIDPASESAFDGLHLDDPSQSSTLRQPVAGSLVPNVNHDALTFVPAVALNHVAGQSETYALSIVGGASGLVGAGGASLTPSVLVANFSVDPNAESIASGGVTLRFTSTDEDVPVFNGVPAGFATPEVRGQVLFDLVKGSLEPRPVTHFSAVVDASQPIVGAMIPFTVPLQTPLTPLGAKSMSVWRYHDLGLPLVDESVMNIDVEGLDWAPFGSSVLADQYPEFRMALTHAEFLPDEALESLSLLPKLPASGLVKTFDANVADPSADPLDVVHAKNLGYSVDPAATFTSATGTLMQPWPMNQHVAQNAFQYYTWRDTALQTLAAPNGAGADTLRYQQVTGQGNQYYAAGQVPTIGLPLLMEFRCYPNASSLGNSQFKVALAINSSAAPYFRAFSSGGVNSSGQTVIVDPDNASVASGGFDSTNGFSTPPTDNVVYFGQADFVVRVSRMHTIWFDTALANPKFSAPIVEPLAASQPAGTQIVLAFRGASAITNPPSAANGASWINAENLDFYGESRSIALGGSASTAFVVTSNPPLDSSWKSNVAAVQGSRFVQVRASFVASPLTNAVPTLSALSLAFEQ